jgi:hypothetical protein
MEVEYFCEEGWTGMMGLEWLEKNELLAQLPTLADRLLWNLIKRLLGRASYAAWEAAVLPTNHDYLFAFSRCRLRTIFRPSAERMRRGQAIDIAIRQYSFSLAGRRFLGSVDYNDFRGSLPALLTLLPNFSDLIQLIA